MKKGSTKFQKSVEYWGKSWPKEAVMVGYAPTDHLHEIVTAHNEDNLSKEGYSLHSHQGALEEAEEWFSSLDLEGVTHLIVYGVGIGYYYLAAQKWLKKKSDRSLIFLEDDLGVIHKLLETDLGGALVKNPQIQLIYFPDLHAEETFEILYWHAAMSKIAITALKSYAEHYPERFKELRNKIAYDASMNNALVDEFLRYGVGFHLNFYQNLLYLPQAALGNDLFGKFYRVPAIICGAGPSLENHLDILKTIQDRALLFAGGSALNALTKVGISPHFGAGIDPNPSQALRLKESNTTDLPFFYRNRMNHEAFKLIRGQRLYITGSGGFKTADYFEKELGIERESIDEGHNVINFLVELATRMGCYPIIFLGMDLAYTNMKGYAPGIISDAKVEKTQILDVANADDVAIERKDIYGKPTYTLWKWVAESEWIGKYAEEHPEAGFVNSTEGGIGFPGVVNLPLKEVIGNHLQRSYELKDRIQREILAAEMPQVTREKVLSAMHKMENSLRRSIEHLDALLRDVKAEIERVKEGKEVGQSGFAALAETELMEEPAYEYILDIFNEVISRVLAREAHILNVKRSPLIQKAIKKLALKERKLQFLRDAALANAELILYAIEKNKDEKLEGTLPKEKPLQNQVSEPPEGFVLIDKNKLPGTDLGRGHILKKVYNRQEELVECYLIKDGKLNGQWQLYYPDGTVKQEGFYKDDKLVVDNGRKDQKDERT